MTLPELLEVITTSIEYLSSRLDRIDTRLDRLESRMDGLESRMDGLESRMDGLDSRLGGLESDVKDIKTKLESWDEVHQVVLDSIGRHEGSSESASYVSGGSRFGPGTAMAAKEAK